MIIHNTGHNVPHRQLRSRKLNRSYILTGQKAQSQCHFEAGNGKIHKRQQYANTFLRHLAAKL